MLTEKSLEMASDHPIAFGAWLVLAAAQNRLLQAQEKIERWLQDADRKAWR